MANQKCEIHRFIESRTNCTYDAVGWRTKRTDESERSKWLQRDRAQGGVAHPADFRSVSCGWGVLALAWRGF